MKRPILFAGLAIAAIATGAHAQTAPATTPGTPSALRPGPSPTPPPIGEPRPFTVPESETFALSNGMNVTLIPYGVAPKVAISLRVFAGNLEEGGDTWLADLAGDMLTEGAGERDAAALATAAAAMGGDLTVAVSPISTAIGIGALSEHAADAIALVADVARRPTFPESEFARVKASSGRNLAQALAQPGVIASHALARAYYGDHPYGRTLPTPAQLDGYTIAQVRDFHARNFGARRAHLYVAGRFDAAAVKAAVERGFAGWQAGPERLSQVPTPNAGPRLLLVDRPGAPQSTVRLAFPAAAPGSEGDIPLRVSNALLGGSFSSRITRNIREDKGYTYSPGSATTMLPGTARWTFQADVTTEATGASLNEVFKEIRTLQQTPPDDAEARGIRTYNAGLFVIGNSTSGALINQLATRDALGLPADWLTTYVPATLAVTPAQISETARATMPLDKLTLVVVGDLDKVRPQLAEVAELKGVRAEVVTVP